MEQRLRGEQVLVTGKQAAELLLQGMQLLLARITVTALSALCIGVFLLTLPARYTQLRDLEQTLHTPLLALGLEHGLLTWYILALDGVTMLACLALGLILLWRRPQNWMALFAALLFSVFGVWITRPPDALTTLDPTLRLASDTVRALGQICTLYFGFLFPGGRFVPRWTRLLALLWTLLTIAWLVFPALPANTIHLPDPSSIPLETFLMFILWLAIGTGCQIYRYARVSSPIQRQQTKWVVFGSVTALFGYIGFSLLTLLFPVLLTPGTSRLLYILLGVPLYYLLSLGFPLSLGFSILRYRLWDIDRLINRTVVYSLLSATLALIYLGVVSGLQFLFYILTGQNSPIAIVISTLLIVALFQPLLTSIQGIIDRRFYRRKYDAARTLATFSMTLRNEVNLEQLSEHLVQVVEETMQPRHVSLWLRPPEPDQAEAKRTRRLSL